MRFSTLPYIIPAILIHQSQVNAAALPGGTGKYNSDAPCDDLERGGISSDDSLRVQNVQQEHTEEIVRRDERYNYANAGGRGMGYDMYNPYAYGPPANHQGTGNTGYNNANGRPLPHQGGGWQGSAGFNSGWQDSNVEKNRAVGNSGQGTYDQNGDQNRFKSPAPKRPRRPLSLDRHGFKNGISAITGKPYLGNMKLLVEE